MKIAQIAPIVERVPPKKYGGTERVVFALTEELIRRGHEVTLFASGDSITSAKLVSVYPRSIRDAKLKDLYGPNILTLLNIGLAYSMQNQFDIIHDHNGQLGLPVANIAQTPTVMTLHGPLTVEIKRIFTTLKEPYLVSISNSQRKLAPNLNYIGCVYNGLNMKDYPFSNSHESYLLFVGRICLEKGTHLAIEVAEYLDLPLVIAAKLDAVDMPYFNEYVGPRLSDNIRWIGEVDEKERNKLMSRALCLLHSITWPEPFGLTMIEAMACGCPVIAFNRGSVPEIIKDGKNGFVIKNEDVDGMIEAVGKLDQINRGFCREYALKMFSDTKMADGYEKIYQRVIKKSKHH